MDPQRESEIEEKHPFTHSGTDKKSAENPLVEVNADVREDEIVTDDSESVADSEDLQDESQENIPPLEEGNTEKRQERKAKRRKSPFSPVHTTHDVTIVASPTIAAANITITEVEEPRRINNGRTTEKKAYSEFMDFLENKNKEACQIGKLVCNEVLKTSRVWELKEEGRENAVSVQDEVPVMTRFDFSPMRGCCKTLNELGKKDEFKSYYRNLREQQFEAVCQIPREMGTAKQFEDWLYEIVGFFAVDERIHRIEPSLVPGQYTENLWKKALSAVAQALDSHFSAWDEVTMIGTFEHALLFTNTMGSFSCDSTQLDQLLKKFTVQYIKSLINKYNEEFARQLDDTNHLPITVENDEEFQAIFREIQFIEQDGYPQKLPFSRFVINVYGQMKEYFVKCHMSMDKQCMRNSHVKNFMRKCTNSLFERWSQHLKQYIRGNRTFIQLEQIIVNMRVMEKACESLSTFITGFFKGGVDPTHSTGHLVALADKVFRFAKSTAELQMHLLLTIEVEFFFTSYNWELTRSTGSASDKIKNLISSIKTIFTSFIDLPKVLAKHFCIKICMHVVEILLKILTSDKFDIISQGALNQFSLDVLHCEEFTAQCPVQGLDNQAMSATFAPIRQLIDLVVGEDWTTFIAEYRNDKKTYDRVQIKDAILILEKKVACAHTVILDSLLQQVKKLAASN